MSTVSVAGDSEGRHDSDDQDWTVWVEEVRLHSRFDHLDELSDVAGDAFVVM